eukprot:644326-Pyramimonas_sp.AAC.1
MGQVKVAHPRGILGAKSSQWGAAWNAGPRDPQRRREARDEPPEPISGSEVRAAARRTRAKTGLGADRLAPLDVERALDGALDELAAH